MVRNNANWSKSAEAIQNWLDSCVSLENPRSYARFTKLRAIFERGRPHFVSADPNNEGIRMQNFWSKKRCYTEIDYLDNLRRYC